MSDRFRAKVRVERAALKIINDSRPVSSQLHGLSLHAIENWRTRSHGTESDRRRDSVLSLLLAISDACQSLSDQSRSAFDPAEFDQTTCATLLTKLQSVCFQEPKS